MTLNGHNGHPSLAGAELPPDGLDLVHQLQDHLRRNPEDVQTWQAPAADADHHRCCRTPPSSPLAGHWESTTPALADT